jgi:hypothetical protein
VTTSATDDPSVRAATTAIFRAALDRRRARQDAERLTAADPPEAA